MKKSFFIFIALAGCANISCAQQNYDPNQTTIDPQAREEMKQTYREAAQEMKRLASEFKTFYDELKTIVHEEGIDQLGSDLGLQEDPTFGSADVIEEDSEMIVRMDMPGILKKDISIRLKDRTILEIEAKREKPDGQKEMAQNERYKGEFKRSIELPAAAAEKGFKAELENGVLTVRVPKAKPGPSGHVQSIPIS